MNITGRSPLMKSIWVRSYFATTRQWCYAYIHWIFGLFANIAKSSISFVTPPIACIFWSPLVKEGNSELSLNFAGTFLFNFVSHFVWHFIGIDCGISWFLFYFLNFITLAFVVYVDFPSCNLDFRRR